MQGWVLCVALALAACSNLETIDPDECGNGIVELGEDCDATNERCVGCAIRCSVDETCASYPGADGFVCGADNLCHAPLGTFKTPAELSASVESFRVTDVDRDGIGDVMIQSQTALSVFYGNFEGAPVATTSTLTPIARGPASYADLDEDGTLDLLLPTADGIAAYTSTYGVPSPHPFPNLVGGIGVPLYTWEVAPNIMAFIGTLNAAPNRLMMIRFDVTAPMLEPTAIDICGDAGAAPNQFDPALIDVFTVEPGYQVVAMTLGAKTATPRVCVMTLRETAGTPLMQRILITGSNLTPAARPVLAPTVDRCPSLIVRNVAASNVLELLPKLGLDDCQFGAPRVLLAEAAGVSPVGWLRLADATPAIVFSHGIFRTGAAGLADVVYVADRRLALARAADLDGDGDADVVASASDSGAAVEDLDILYQGPGAAFLRYRLDTAGPVTLFAVGDHDGNARADIALVQQQNRDGIERQELAIAYGTSDQLLAPVGVVSFASVASLVITDLPDSTDPGGLVDDMIVLYGGTAPQLTLLRGSPQRTLTGFFDPRPAPTLGGQGERRSLFRGVVGGRFETATNRPGLDLLAVDAVDDGRGIALDHRTELWLSDGATGGIAEELMPFVAPEIERCELGIPVSADPFCTVDARYVALPATGGGADRVLGVDKTGHGLLVERTPTPRITRFGDIAALVTKAQLRALELVELADGPRLVASFVGDMRSVVVCRVDVATGLPAGCIDVAAAVLAGEPRGPYRCADVAAARVVPHARFAVAPVTDRELVALCFSEGTGTTLFRLAVDGAGYVPHRLLAIEPAQELRAGDVNGDALDDLLTVDRSGAIPTFRLYPQCTTRDTTGCRGAQ